MQTIDNIDTTLQLLPKCACSTKIKVFIDALMPSTNSNHRSQTKSLQYSKVEINSN